MFSCTALPQDRAVARSGGLAINDRGFRSPIGADRHDVLLAGNREIIPSQVLLFAPSLKPVLHEHR